MKTHSKNVDKICSTLVGPTTYTFYFYLLQNATQYSYLLIGRNSVQIQTQLNCLLIRQASLLSLWHLINHNQLRIFSFEAA
jgi:hypothetical protein